MSARAEDVRVDESLARRIHERIRRRLSPINADLCMRRALDRIGKKAPELTLADVPAFAIAVNAIARTFIGTDAAGTLAGDINALQNEVSETRDRIDIEAERDVARARSAAHAACTVLGASTYSTQRAVTLVSELARNIVAYAQRGAIELQGRRGFLVVIAEDRGSGIKDLEHVLSGAYVSKTGLGKGLLGCKRLAARFDVRTGPRGTRVEAEIAL